MSCMQPVMHVRKGALQNLQLQQLLKPGRPLFSLFRQEFSTSTVAGMQEASRPTDFQSYRCFEPSSCTLSEPTAKDTSRRHCAGPSAVHAHCCLTISRSLEPPACCALQQR